jgi:polysaccharide deacetylase family protein (PEP-CTERM system associated)
MEKKNITNAMTVDVEDYFHVSAFESYIDKKQWDSLPQRVEKNTNHILDVFDEYNTKATFFTLGWVAERYPQLIRRIIKEGHELACHGYEHIRATEQSSEEFRNDVVKTKLILEDIGGQEIKGYRAASYSIGEKNLWAHNILVEEGFKYSSSIYPVKHDLYGMPQAPRFTYKPIANNDFLEIPISTIKFANKNFSCGGGGFFRFYPYVFSRWAFKKLNNQENQSGIFYFHPWEIDPEQPRQKKLDLKTQYRHYLNLDKMEHRINCLLRDFHWDTMEKVFLSER